MKTIIKQKLKEIDESIELIKDNIPRGMEEFKALGLVKDGIYKKLEFSIQNLIDIFSLIYSSLNLGVPSTLDDIFDGLRDKKVFSSEIISLVQEMKGLRNILIHKYGKINDSIIFELVSERLDDFEKIVDVIEKHLN